MLGYKSESLFMSALIAQVFFNFLAFDDLNRVVSRRLITEIAFTLGQNSALSIETNWQERMPTPGMGSIVAAEADLAVVTSDNPRTEDPDRIIDDVVEGMEGRAHLRITDRREAIGRAIGMLDDGDCLLLAGKGHETYQVIGAERSPFDEREIVADILGERAAS